MNLNDLIYQIQHQPDAVEFNTVITLIDQLYHYTPTGFSNGLAEHKIDNKAGSNEGSCKIFAFADRQNLSEQETLTCFGHYYRNDVLAYPDASDHANIRNFMRFGWKGIQFSGSALELKQ